MATALEARVYFCAPRKSPGIESKDVCATGRWLPFLKQASRQRSAFAPCTDCLLYTSDAADDMQCVDLGGL
eukprot:3719835-Alexandrium_andersonii.AAC.1